MFERDNHKCKVCGCPDQLDAHHITDRNLMPNGGYILENGISLCPNCHIEAEKFHSGEKVKEGFFPDDLYNLINSSFELAKEQDRKL